MKDRSTKRIDSKPSKPYPEFPLFPHATRRWAKKVRGKLLYFGPWDDPNGALDKWLAQKDDLLAGRAPRPTGGVTIGDLCNRFLTAKKHLVDTGELTPRSFADYYRTCKLLVEAFGKNRLVEDLHAADFESLRKRIAKTRGPVALGNEIGRVRVLFKYAYDSDLIQQPIKLGPTFRRPSKKVLRAQRQAQGLRMFGASELRALVSAASLPLKAMVLLGINCGFGNHDVGTLPLSAVDLKAGWVDFPRPKTAVRRRCSLWPETIEAINAAIANRPKPKDGSHAGLVFLTRRGSPWSKIADLRVEVVDGTFSIKNNRANPVSHETAKLLKKLGINRQGLNFYALRHTFATIGAESKDQVAVDAIMGHIDPGMSAVYREKISDERLKAVADHVRHWLLVDGRRDDGMNDTEKSVIG